MPLHTDPARFSITAFLADQVTLVARHEHLSPGQAVLRLQELSRDTRGHGCLLAIVREAERRATDPDERSKLAALTAQITAWAPRNATDAP